ncbi:SCLY [Symbiodinium natans]|uniref:SCLY protein n=1 Tax=Symbiodinium natans TaxID=878477 RepID=A0A812SYU2_9DINO|nr:SCLY [Symbiodinium natans]
MAETSLHAALAAWEQRAPRARQLAAGAHQARSAALHRAAEVNSNLGASSMIRAFGPENCVSTWRDATSGTCFLKTECEGVQHFDFFDMGFLCENADKAPVEHRFGTMSFARVEVQDTDVACERCMPAQDKPQTAESLSQEMRAMKQSLSKASDTFLSLKAKASELLR